MTSEISAIGVAFCGTFLVCPLLFKQQQKRSAKNRWWSPDGSGSDGGSYLGDSGNHLGGIGGNHSHSGSHSHAGHGGDHSGSGHPGDSGSSGGGGGGDGGGGDGGGGGSD